MIRSLVLLHDTVKISNLIRIFFMQCPLSGQLQEYSRSTRALIFVVDSKDSDRLLKCKEELWSLLDIDDLRDVIVLVIANKQDLHGAMSVEEIRKTLDIEKIVDREIGKNNNYHISLINSGMGFFLQATFW